jgi:general secretion pathway protein F/type IV pilus assembly protein PilC
MPVFHYEAVTLSGQQSSGTLDAADRGEAIRKLSRKGLQPSSVRAGDATEVKGAPSARSQGRADAGSPPPRVEKGKEKEAPAALPLRLKRGQVIQFTEELCDLLGAGLQLEQALHAMENRSTSLQRHLATHLRGRVRDGIPFSIALHQVSPSFGELYGSLVGAGEASGSLPSILERQARYLNQMQSLQSKVTTALIYPAFIVVSGVALAVLFITYLLPKLAILITSTNGELPGIAVGLMAMSAFLHTWWWAILAALAGAGAAVFVLFKDPVRLQWWHRVQLKLPVYGGVLWTRFEVQFLETLGNLLHNGLPLHRALELVRKTTMNLHLRERLALVEGAVGDGGSLSRAVEKHGVARPLVVDMIRVGEQTGDLSDSLQKAAGRFEVQLTKSIDRATALLQPVIIVVMAGMVGVMAWMMISVVYGTLENLRRQ